jgi:hypothetical protein
MANDSKRIWICFDLGLRGEYTELYAWLDQQHATECGDNVATFRSQKNRDQIAKELETILDLKRNPRVYVIEHHVGGRFVLGKRKVAPWTGYGQASIDSGEES